MTSEISVVGPHVKQNYFSVQLKTLFWMGIDILPVKNKTFSFLYSIYSKCFILLFVYIYVLSEFLGVIFNFTNLNEMTFGLAYIITHILSCIKVSLLLLKRKSLWNMIQKLEKGVFRPNINRGGEKEYEVINTAIKFSNYQGATFYFFVIFIIGFRAIFVISIMRNGTEHLNVTSGANFTQDIKILPFTTYFPFDTNTSPSYQIAFLFQVCGAGFAGLYIGAVDAIICGMMMHIKSQFLILQFTLDTAIDRAKSIVSKDHNSNQIYDLSYNKVTLPKGITKSDRLSTRVQEEVEKIIIDCVYHHQEIIHLGDEMEIEFNYLMLMQFLGSILLLCFQLFQLSLTKPASSEFGSMCSYLLAMMFQILCYCWTGNELILISSELPQFVFGVDWILLNNSTKISLLLMMMRAQRSMKITAGKFALLSLQTFVTIVRGSVSYFMVLKQMNN